jgi:ribosomal protein S18 acetylase RimI-like enzyme
VDSIDACVTPCFTAFALAFVSIRRRARERSVRALKGPVLSWVVSYQSTTNHGEALAWSNEILGVASAAAFFLAPSRFVRAERTDDSLSLSLSDGDGTGVLFGPRPPLGPDWSRCLVSDATFGEQLGDLVKYDQWDFYTRATKPASDGSSVEVLHDDDTLTGLLRTHAPHSAVWPGDTEIVDWFGRRDATDRLVCVGALVRWESGWHVLSSVATVIDARGQGHALALVRGVVHAACERDVAWLGLGVAHDNTSAQRVYVRAGFTLRSSFTNYHRPSLA